MTSKRDGRGRQQPETMAKASKEKISPAKNPGGEEDELPPIWQKISDGILQSINERFDKFEKNFQGLIASQQMLKERMSDVEKQAAEQEQRIVNVEKSLADLEKENKDLRSKLSDLEGRSRRNNIKIVGIPEGEEKGRPTDFVSHRIPKLLGAENFDKPVVIDRAHHTLQPKPADGAKPRTIIARVHLAQEKEKILQLGRQRTLDYGGSRIFIFPDYTAEVMEKRRSFKEVLQLLREKNVQHSLRFPARLHIQHQGQVKAFSSPADAKNFIDNKLN